MIDDRVRVAAPRPPESPPPFAFPVIATLAPVVAAIAIWLLTSSPFALVFAGLGPVAALASFADSRVRARRTRSRESVRFARDLDLTVTAIDDAHDRERSASAERTPAAREIMSRRGADPYRWRADSRVELAVSLGSGESASAVHLARPALEPSAAAALIAAFDELEDRASRSEGSVTVDARLGIGIVGTGHHAAAIARSLAVQVAWALSPADHWATAGAGESVWVAALPHRTGSTSPVAAREIRFGRQGVSVADIVIAVAESASDLPGRCAVVVRAGGADGGAITGHPDRHERRAVRLDAVSLDEAAEWAQALCLDAEREGCAPRHSRLPAEVALEALPVAEGAQGLTCQFAVGGDGPVVIDLVHHGPHAVVGGTTGSGKSELLISWMLALASAHPPSAVTFLLVDFKGGAAFDVLRQLPHTAGIITDLDGDHAARALESLRAELRHRERWLASLGARDVDEVADLPRLVIVIDEFAAMMTELPELHALFADIAARGRSLGVHLILCTQRPAGVVRDSVLANADLRISLRVNNRSDSEAVVGEDAAAEIPASARGRGILRRAGERPDLVQFALAGDGDAHRIAALWQGSAPARAPWCEPLPSNVALAEVPESADGIAFGLLDLPSEQRRGTAVWHPARDGHVLILGGPGSGKSVALDTLAARAAGESVQWLPSAADAAWDALADLARARERLVAVDDLDSLLARVPPDYRSSFVERLTEVLRDGPGRGIRVAITAQRLTAELTSLAGIIPQRLLLRHASRQELVLAGGDGASFVPSQVAGAGLWRGDRVQIAQGAPRRPADAPAKVVDLAEDRPLAIVSGRAGILAERLASVRSVVDLATLRDEPARVLAAPISTMGRTILVGTVDDWQSRWGALAAVRAVADVLFDSCTTADFRALTRSRELPPPLLESMPAEAIAPGTLPSVPRRTEPSLCWRLEADGTATRVRLPA